MSSNNISKHTNVLTRKSISEAYYQSFDLENPKIAQDLSKIIINTISDILIEKKSLILPNIGMLKTHHKSERIARNPRTGEEAVVTERYVVTLSLHRGKKVINKVNRKEVLDRIRINVLSEFENQEDISYKEFTKQFIDTEGERKVLNIFSKLIEKVQGDTKVEIRGFGIFKPVHVPSHKARNPKNNDTVITEEKNKILFKCSKKLEAKINK